MFVHGQSSDCMLVPVQNNYPFNNSKKKKKKKNKNWSREICSTKCRRWLFAFAHMKHFLSLFSKQQSELLFESALTAFKCTITTTTKQRQQKRREFHCEKEQKKQKQYKIIKQNTIASKKWKNNVFCLQIISIICPSVREFPPSFYSYFHL